MNRDRMTSPVSTATKLLPTIAAKSGSIVILVAALLMTASLSAAPWIHIPPAPELQLSESTMRFSEISKSVTGATPPLQAAYFDWLAWLLVTVTIAISILSVTLQRSALFALEALIAASALAIGTIAAKGPVTWSDYLSNIHNLRIGSYMITAGFLMIGVHGLAKLAQAGRH